LIVFCRTQHGLFTADIATEKPFEVDDKLMALNNEISLLIRARIEEESKDEKRTE
jgi:hypothetical protein